MIHEEDNSSYNKSKCHFATYHKPVVKDIYQYIFAIIMFTLSSVTVYAQSTSGIDTNIETKQDVNEKTLLIINSYSENSTFTQSFTNPIMIYVAEKDNVHCEMECMNNILITDSVTYSIVTESIMKKYADDKPSYVVFIGNTAFSMRDMIKEQWGDIPMLLFTRDEEIGEESNYFSGFDKELIPSETKKLSELQPDFNFTAIIIPYTYKRTIKLMKQLQPQMKELVFISDDIYINRNIASRIRDFLIVEYPGLKFKWLQASPENSDKFLYYMINRLPETGLLLSTWGYKITNQFGSKVVANELNLISNSVNPIFTLRESYISLGAIGGVFYDEDVVGASVTNALEQMFAGKPMRDLPFYHNNDDYNVVLNYRLLSKYDIKESDCPAGSILYNKPKTFFERYTWEIISTLFITLCIIFYLLYRNTRQRKEIGLLRRHQEFVGHMPIPYSKALIKFDNNGHPVNIQYEITNKAFDDLITNNSIEGTPFRLFPADFISKKIEDLIETHNQVRFVYHFDKTDAYYQFRICIVDLDTKHKDTNIKSVDIFATDISNRMKTELKLKEMTSRLDMALNLGGIIPWEWNMETDLMKIDAYSIFKRNQHKFNGTLPIENNAEINAITEFFPLFHPDDIEIMRKLRADLLSNKIDSFHNIEYRLQLAHENKPVIEWVRISGKVTKYDNDGKPVVLMGILRVITDLKDSDKTNDN